MRSFSTILAAASLVGFTIASPEPMFNKRDGSCMTASEADQVASNFAELIANYTSTAANNYLTTNFEDYSDSVTSLIDAGCTGPQTVS